MRHIIILTIPIIISSCGNHRVDGSLDNKIDTIYVSSEIDTAKNNDEISLTNLDYLNSAPEYPFVAEDSIIGIGIVTLSDSINTYDEKLRIYDEAGKIMITVEQKDSDVITIFKGKTFDRYNATNPLSPRLFITNPDYFRLIFDCISIGKDSYKVIISKQTGETAEIKKEDKFFQFQSMETFVDEWTTIGLDFDRSKNPLRKSPSDNSEIIKNNKEAKYKIWQAGKKLMQGEWIKIQIENTNEKGWIRWKKGNQILIRMYFIC
jgi:hypothetical protein